MDVLGKTFEVLGRKMSHNIGDSNPQPLDPRHLGLNHFLAIDSGKPCSKQTMTKTDSLLLDNMMKPEQNDQHFADSIFLNENILVFE